MMSCDGGAVGPGGLRRVLVFRDDKAVVVWLRSFG